MFILTEPVVLTDYFEHLDSLKKNENWQEIVHLGEKALKTTSLDPKKAFLIRDQLVSTYFRIGNFDKAFEHAEHLLALGAKLLDRELVVKSYYKLSAVFRGMEKFEEAKKLAAAALEGCPNDPALRAKVLFNYGAAECDDLKGSPTLGISYYREALDLFNEINDEDYAQRTAIRLGKAYLLQKEISQARTVVDELKHSSLERRTKMHLHYLEAQVLRDENRLIEALKIATLGIEEANRLEASADVKRFHALITEILEMTPA